MYKEIDGYSNSLLVRWIGTVRLINRRISLGLIDILKFYSLLFFMLLLSKVDFDKKRTNTKSGLSLKEKEKKIS
jgi:hypothetical protein